MSSTGKIIVGLLSLVGVLAYNFTHTGGLLASYVEPRFVGYVAAFGIELAVVGLSLRIDELRRTQGQVAFHVLTLAAVVIVSALANIAEGYAVKFGEPLTSANIGLLDGVQVVVSLAATGLLSLVTFAIAEIVGHDIGANGEQADSVTLDEDCHCPICYNVIGLPVWLSEQHGDKYVAYCDKCERAYTESEVVWLPVGAQVGASVPQPAATPPQAWRPANLTPDSGQKIDGQTEHTPQSRQNATSSDSGEKRDESTTPENTAPENADSATVAVWDADGLSGAERVRLYSAANPHASKLQVAALLGVNLSTVSRNWRGNGTHKKYDEEQG